MPIQNFNLYESLRNSQPLAFLASLSIVIAAFTFSNQAVQVVYQNAVIAAFAFILSFIFSLCAQIFRRNLEKTTNYFDLGTFFFLAIGILYLILIIVDFTKTINQISQIFISWTFMFMGVIAAYSSHRKIKQLKANTLSSNDQIILPAIVITAVVGIAGSTLIIVSTAMGFSVETKTIYIAVMGSTSMIGFLSIVLDVYHWIKPGKINKKNSKKD